MRTFLQSTRNPEQIYEVLAYNAITNELKLDGLYAKVFTTKSEAKANGYRPLMENDPIIQAWLVNKNNIVANIKLRKKQNAKFSDVRKEPAARTKDDAGAGGEDESYITLAGETD